MPFATLDGRRIEYRLIPGAAGDVPPLVFLHEGLGCAALWRDFPDKIARRLGTRAAVYSRFGYGQSDGILGPRTPRFMHEEALDVLPRLLAHWQMQAPLLIGHSDGASIALIHAALAERPVAGVVLMAPHVFVETVCVASIARISETYATTDLKSRLSRYHARPDDAFLGWSRIWLDPAFRSWSIVDAAAQLTVPALLIQGTADAYGTLAQIEAIAAAALGPTQSVVLEACGHAPHREQENAVMDAIAGFVAARL
jgi:pimeloyl-ACP methyl ester carboxylesterase